MNTLKKIAVLLPVTVIMFLFFRDHYERLLDGVIFKRLLLFFFAFAILYGWMIQETVKRRQDSFFQVGLQSSFLVYAFMVLTLTGYFVLHKEVSAHDWWERMMRRIERKDHVNLKLFQIFRIYSLSNKQVLGNLVMLLPLGIYLPLLYRGTSNFIAVLVASFLISFLIELLQLVTSYRSADVDDLLLNTLGACAGFALFRLGVRLFGPRSR